MRKLSDDDGVRQPELDEGLRLAGGVPMVCVMSTALVEACLCSSWLLPVMAQLSIEGQRTSGDAFTEGGATYALAVLDVPSYLHRIELEKYAKDR